MLSRIFLYEPVGVGGMGVAVWDRVGLGVADGSRAGVLVGLDDEVVGVGAEFVEEKTTLGL